MPDSSAIKSPPTLPSEWEPRWTVITTSPSFAERWAVRAMSHRRQHISASLVWLVYNVLAGMRHWSDGETGWLIADIVLFVLVAASSWERYAFGQLLERYDAELRDLQTHREPA